MENLDIFPLCKSSEGQTLSTIIVEYRNENNMKIHSSLHNNIENVWQNKLKCCTNLFNARKFRLHQVEFCTETELVSPKLKLCFGITCYKDFIGTNCAPYAQQLRKDGLKDYSNPQAYMADPIGVGGLLITSDNDVILIRRSNTCAEMPNLIDRPGGHPEPDVVLSNTKEIESIPGSIIAQEIFISILREIRDEINIPLEYLSSPILLGIGYNPNTWRRPSLEFYVRCNLQTREVQKLYQEQTQAECDESTELIVIPLEKIMNNIKEIDLYNEFTQPLKCAIKFLNIFAT